jgi:hypothetical protein
MTDLIKSRLKALCAVINKELLEQESGAALCMEQSWEGFLCTRLRGHEGPHIATGSEDVHKVWKRDESTVGRLP